MASAAPSRDELLVYVQAYRHHRETQRRAAPGTHARVAAARRMEEVSQAFERRIRAWGVDERLRQSWRDTLHRNAPAPLRPAAAPAVLFVGRSDANVEARVIAAPDGAAEVHVGNAVIRRLPALSLAQRDGRTLLELGGGQTYVEVFTAPKPALDALRAWSGAGRGEPPFEHATELLNDGLVDRNFSLTARGRRAVAPPVPAREPALV